MEPRVLASAAPAVTGEPAGPVASVATGAGLGWLLEVLRRNLVPILATILVADLLVAAWLLVRPLSWTATTELLIEPEDRGFGNLREEIDLRVDRLQPADIESEVKVLASRRLARAVVEAEKLAREVPPDPPLARLRDALAGAGEGLMDWVAGIRSSFAGYPTDLSARTPDRPEVAIGDEEALLERFERALSIRRDPLARVVTIAYTAHDPTLAARVVDRLAQLYLEERVASQREALQQTAQYLQERLAVLARELEEAERRVKDFQSSTGLFAGEGGSALERRWAELGRELTQARIQLADARARLSQLETARQEGGVASLREVAGSVVIAELRRQEAEVARRIADLQGQYGPRHPLMQNARAELADLRRSIAAEIGRIGTQLGNEVAIGEERVARLEAELAETERRLAMLGSSQVELAELQRRAEAARKVYETMLDRYRRASEQQNLIRPAARIISPASPPTRPSNSPKLVVLAFTTVAGAGLGCAIAFLRELRRKGFLTSAELERALRSPVLAVLPRLPDPAAVTGEPEDGAAPAPVLAWREAVQRIVARLSPAPEASSRRGRVIGLTSAFPGDGKTTLALALARRATRSGRRVLLIDGDLRLRSLGRRVDAPEDAPGLAEILAGDVGSIERALYTDPCTRLRILPAGAVPERPHELLASPRARLLMAGLRELCDLVIVDLPPVLAVSDVLALAPALDEVLLVVRWQTTPREAVAAAARELAEVGLPVVGIALNAVDLATYGRYGSADHLRYAARYAAYYGARG